MKECLREGGRNAGMTSITYGLLGSPLAASAKIGLSCVHRHMPPGGALVACLHSCGPAACSSGFCGDAVLVAAAEQLAGSCCARVAFGATELQMTMKEAVSVTVPHRESLLRATEAHMH
jgi:hypothetical protein